MRYILKDGENLGKFDAKVDVDVFLDHSTTSKTYKVYNQNSLNIKKSSNVVINDTKYDQRYN